MVNPYSFSDGFSNGFEQSLNYLSATYTIIPATVAHGSGTKILVNNLFVTYELNVPSILNSSVALPQNLLTTYDLNVPSILNSFVASPQNLASSYTVIPVTVTQGSGTEILVNNLVSTYDLNTVTITQCSGTEILVNNLTSTYELNEPSILNSFVALPQNLASTYNLNTVVAGGTTSIVINVSVSPQNLTSTYELNEPSILNSFVALPQNLASTYTVIPVTVTQCSGTEILVNNFTSTYDLNDPSILEGFGYNVSVDSIGANYNLLIPILVITSSDILNATYTIENPNIVVGINYTFTANVVSSTYNFNIPEIIIALPEWYNCPQVPFNSYWRDDADCKDNERFLYDSLQLDVFNKFGVTWVYYSTTYNLTRDVVFKEDPNRVVTRCFSAKGMIEDLPVEQKIYRMDGIFGADTVKAYFSKLHFNEASTYANITPSAYPSISPSIGDYIYLGSNDIFYEVISVKDTVEQFQNRAHNYELTLRVYRDTKLTVSAGSPTLVNDRILTVCTSATSATTQFEDYLAINTDIDQLVSAIEYVPKPGEKAPGAFGGW